MKQTELIRIASHTVKTNQVNILYDGISFVVIDLEGWYNAKDFKTLEECYEYLECAYDFYLKKGKICN